MEILRCAQNDRSNALRIAEGKECLNPVGVGAGFGGGGGKSRHALGDRGDLGIERPGLLIIGDASGAFRLSGCRVRVPLAL
jgi:hypothetical protein